MIHAQAFFIVLNMKIISDVCCSKNHFQYDHHAMNSIYIYAAAAVVEIACCFAFWAWLRLGRDVWWLLPGVVSLVLFALLLTQVESDYAGRAYAAYGGIYIVISLVWLWLAEGKTPDYWDLIGATICLLGAAIILFAPRPSVF